MPRDANGNYTLPAGNPVITDTNIESTWANNTLQDVAAEMTDSLSRSGKGALTGPLQIIDESGGVPGLAFGNEPTSGIKRAAAGDVRMQVQGTDRMRWRAGASQVPEVQVAGVWKEVALLEAARKVMQGVGGETAVWFYNATVPAAAGWELKVADTNLRNLTIAPGGATPVGGGTIDGADDPSAMAYTKDVTPVGTVANADAPHTHSFSATSSFPLQGATQSLDGTGSPHAQVNHSHSVSGTTGSDNANHNHGFTGAANSVDINFNPRRAMGVLGLLSA